MIFSEPRIKFLYRKLTVTKRANQISIFWKRNGFIKFPSLRSGRLYFSVYDRKKQHLTKSIVFLDAFMYDRSFIKFLNCGSCTSQRGNSIEFNVVNWFVNNVNDLVETDTFMQLNVKLPLCRGVTSFLLDFGGKNIAAIGNTFSWRWYPAWMTTDFVENFNDIYLGEIAAPVTSDSIHYVTFLQPN